MKKNIMVLSQRFSIAVVALTFSNFASAQLLEEIIVEAQKREQNLQDVGIAVTAFSGDQLRALGITDSIDLVAQTPGLWCGRRRDQYVLYSRCHSKRLLSYSRGASRGVRR